MSTILKALRRLEHEKNSQSERPLREQIVSSPETKRGIPITVAVGAIFAAGLALGAAALMLWPRPDDVVSAGRTPDVAVAAGPVPEASAETVEPPFPAAPAPAASPGAVLADLPNEAFASSVAVVERKGAPVEAHQVLELTATPPFTGPPPEGLRPAGEAMKPKPRFRPAPARRKRGQPAPSPSVAPAPASAPSLASAPVPPATPARLAAVPEGVRVASADRPAPPPPEAPAPEMRPPRVTQSAPEKKPAIPEITPRLASPPAPAAEPDPKPVVVAKAEPVSKSPATSAQAEPEAAKASPPSPPTGVQVARTHWHPLPGKRIAIVEVEGRPEPLQLHEGDLVGSLVVGTIQPSGVVFLRDGVEVRSPVGAGR